MPDEQRRAEFSFQIGDRRRDRGLRDEAAFGGRLQVALPNTGASSELANILGILSTISISIFTYGGRMAQFVSGGMSCASIINTGTMCPIGKRL